MKDIVFLTSRFPWPLDKGDKLRVYYQIRDLSQHVNLHLICLSEEDVSAEELSKIEAICASVKVYRLRLGRKVLGLSIALFRALPLQVGYFYSPFIRRQIQADIQRIQPDHLHCHLIRTTEYIRGLAFASRSLDYMDAFAEGMKKRAEQTSNPLKKWLFRFEERRLRHYEAMVFDFVERHCIISKQDREAIKHPDSQQIQIVANGVDFELFSPRETPKHYDLVFMGNLAYPPNIAAIAYWMEEVMPLIWRSRPQTNLLLAGIDGTDQIKTYQNDRVRLIENWTDISDSIAQSRILIAPMQISIGLQNKIIQAMAMKVACIVSESANRAIGAQPGHELIALAEAKDYAAATITLLDHARQRQQLAEAGYRFVRQHFDWRHQNQLLLSCM
ncbi:MAG: glycosyltransferase, partial [Bacteroidota bacterium]